MPSLRTRSLSFAFSDEVPLFSAVDLHLVPGGTGLVGGNGSGKSTLLRLLAGELHPTRGAVVIEPASARRRYCPQTTGALSPDIEAFAIAWDVDAVRLRHLLRLDPDALDRWTTLSPGERQRWQLGAAIADAPDVLLLDEPESHLDADARRWLAQVLRRYAGVLVLVSHDRDLLDAITTSTLRVHAGPDGGRVTHYGCAYSDARASWTAERDAVIAERARELERHQKTLARLDAERREQEAAARNRNAGRRMKDRHDSDSRSVGATTLAGWAEARLGRTAGNTRRRAERVLENIGDYPVDTSLGRSVFARYERPKAAWLMGFEDEPLRVGDRELLPPTSLAVHRESRVRIEGPNGAGKSTLLRKLLASRRVPRERLLYLPQEDGGGPDPKTGAALLAEVRALESDTRGRVLQLVAALGVDPDRLLASESPSPGEARKLMLARGLGDTAWALLLDEPTNYLDLPAIERLEAALTAYPGAIVLISHDERFGRGCTNETWRLGEGQLVHR